MHHLGKMVAGHRDAVAPQALAVGEGLVAQWAEASNGEDCRRETRRHIHVQGGGLTAILAVLEVALQRPQHALMLWTELFHDLGQLIVQVDLDAQKQKALAEIRRQRELAAKERTQAEMRAQQLADARASQTDAASPASPPRGNPNSRSSNQAAYIVALQDAILRQWTRPESVKLDDVCQVLIRQIPGGEVVSVEIAPSCPYDALGRRSVEAAILKASPLPYAGFEDAFIRDPVLKFRARDAADL